MNFSNIQRARALLSDRWVYGFVETFEPGTCMIGDVNVKKETVSSLKGFDTTVSWKDIDISQKREFVNMINSMLQDHFVTTDTVEKYWRGMPIFE